VRLRIRLRLRLKYRTGKRPSHSTLASASVYFWSGREDLNLRHPAPKAGALPGCATPRRGISAGCILPYCSRFFKSYSAPLADVSLRQLQKYAIGHFSSQFAHSVRGHYAVHNQWQGKVVSLETRRGLPMSNDVSNSLLCSKAGALPSCVTPRLGLISLTAAIRL
jgi:hypothetical protein